MESKQNLTWIQNKKIDGQYETTTQVCVGANYKSRGMGAVVR